MHCCFFHSRQTEITDTKVLGHRLGRYLSRYIANISRGGIGFDLGTSVEEYHEMALKRFDHLPMDKAAMVINWLEKFIKNRTDQINDLNQKIVNESPTKIKDKDERIRDTLKGQVERAQCVLKEFTEKYNHAIDIHKHVKVKHS